MNLMHSLISTWRSEALRTKHASAKATLSMLTRSCRPLPISLMRRLIPLASDQEIQPKECCCRCTGSDNNYTFRVKRIQWQIDEPICAHDEQSQGANQVDRPAHWSHRRLSIPTRSLLEATSRYKATSWVEEIHTIFAQGYSRASEAKFWGAGAKSIKAPADYIVIGFLIACMLSRRRKLSRDVAHKRRDQRRRAGIAP